MDTPVNNPKPSRPRGRPKRVDAPIVPWDDVDRLLVHGETVKDEETGQKSTSFPSLSELGKRYGVSKNRIWQYASKHKCLERRKESEAREQIRYDRIVSARRAEARALATSDVVRVVDAYIVGFEQALEEGKVRFDSPADLDRMVRLKELLLGNADSRQELQGGITLEAIQARHQRVRAQVDRLTPEVSGEVSGEVREGGDAAVN
ncbi:MAG: hypothetical protein ACOY3Y_10775 [Acidobacteriota bacterium]